MWIATDKGLYRYDGVNLALYNIIPPQTYIFSMLEDRQGQIWLGTQGRYGEEREGFIILDTKRGIEKHLFLSDGSANRGVLRMLLDNEGKVWTTTRSGVEIIDEKTLTLKYFDRAQGLGGDFPFCITKDNQNNIWITVIGVGIDIVDLHSRKIKHLNQKFGLVNDNPINIICDEKNKMWVGTAINCEISAIDLRRRIITSYHHDFGKASGLIWDLFKDDKGNVWIGTANPGIGTGNGVEILNPEKGLIKTINKPNEISNNNSGAILRDSRGRIWIGTDRGLNLINPENDIEIEHAGTDDITALAEDDHGKIWIATTSSGIKILDRATGAVRQLNASNGLCSNNLNDVSNRDGEIWIISSYNGIDIIDTTQTMMRHIGKTQGLSTDTLGAIMKDQQRRMWISGPNTGADILDLATWKLFHLGSAQNFHDDFIHSFAQDKRGRIWVASNNNGVGVIDPITGNALYYKNVPQFMDRSFRSFLADSSDNIWVRTFSGNFIINAQRDSIIHFSSKEGLIDTAVISLNEYDHHIYAGTEKGVSIITAPLTGKKEWKARSFGRESGIEKLITTQESDIVTRGGEFLWGDKGITFLKSTTPANDVPVKITGIYIFNEVKYFADKPALSESDTLWGEKNTFYIKGQLPANILFQENGKIRFDSVTGPYHLPVNLRLPYNENYLQFHFVQPSIAIGSTVLYRYILEGIDKTWSDKTANDFSQNYPNLSPGDYTFKVISKSNDTWSKPAEFSFTIAPPWWKTWWAYCIYGLLLIALAFFVHRYQKERVLRKERERTKAKELEQAKEIEKAYHKLEQAHEALKSTQAQLIQQEKMASLGELTAGIAHEIQNPLNFVNNFSEVNNELIEELRSEKLKVNSENEKDLLDDIFQNNEKIILHGKRADAIVKGMLQHSRSSSGQKELTDINALCDEYLRLAYHGLRAKDKSFNAKFRADFDPSIGKINIVPQEIGRVILNLINNAFYAVSEKAKQNIPGYEPIVIVSTKTVKPPSGGLGAKISVIDNGGGIPQNVVDKIFQPFFTTKPTGQGTGLGLSLSYDIIKAHGGEIKVETKEGEGSEFTVELPINRYMK
jgi:signal transduction histidine kinase/ligand-binding sensor domain-containing protein